MSNKPRLIGRVEAAAYVGVSRLRELLHYDPETGVFTWAMDKNRARKGMRAGKVAKSGYRRIQIDGVQYNEHELAWLYVHGERSTPTIDHKNMVKTDNAIANLRQATTAQNQQNKPAQSNNTSGFKGVSKFARTGRWRAEIKANGVKKYLGSFADPEAAAEAYRAAAANLHGEFARDNDGPITEAA